MDEKVYNKLMKVCDELEAIAVSYLGDVNVRDIYNDRLYFVTHFHQKDNKAYWILLQLCTISRFKETLKKLKTVDILNQKGIKEGDTE